MTTPLLIRAAEILEEEAACLRRSCTSPADGSWPDDESPESRAREGHDEMLAVAKGLREKERADIAFANNLSQAFNSGDGSYHP